MFCNAVLSPIVTVVRTLVQVVREIVTTVCEWVSSTITIIKEVTEKVCTWLPWPLNKLCDWVTKLIEVVETVWDFVCEEVIETILEWVEVFVEYVIYVLKWVCWIIDWPFRAIGLLLCSLDIRPTKFVGVCVKILADENGTPAIPVADVMGQMRDAAAIVANCNVRLVVCSVDVVPKPEYLDTTSCEFGGMFKRFFTWFSSNTCGCCNTVTVYFVRDIVGASGCAYPGTDWVTVDAQGDGTVVIQEILHLADIWPHSSDPNNVMTDQPGGTHDQITGGQCCMLRTSRFARYVVPCLIGRLSLPLRELRLEAALGEPFSRKDRVAHDHDE